MTTAVVSSFGSWSDKPFAAIVLVAFVACGSPPRGSPRGRSTRWLATEPPRLALASGSIVARRRSAASSRPRSPAVSASCSGLEATAVGSLITFGTAAIYVSFLLVAVAALIARLRGTWRPAGRVRLGRLGLPINVAAVVWLAFETVNIAWPRGSLAPPDAPWYQVWAAPLVLWR